MFRWFIPLSAFLLLSPMQFSLPAMAEDPAFSQGITLLKKGLVKQSLPLIEKAMKDTPKAEAPHVWYAKALLKQGGSDNIAKAQGELRQVLKINPDHPEALTLLSETLSWQAAAHPEVLDQCIQLTKRAAGLLSGKPQYEETYLSSLKNLTQWLYWRGYITEARVYGDTTINESKKAEQAHKLPKRELPQNDPAWVGTYAAILSQTGQAEQAVQLYEQLLPQNSNSYVKIDYATALGKAGRNSEAEQIFQELKTRLAATKPAEAVDLKQKLASLAYEIGAYSDALALDAQLPPDVQQTKGVQLRMARTYGKSARATEAIDIFQKLYTSGQLTAQEKMEYGDYLLNFALPSTALPTPDLKERLYEDALKELPETQAYNAYIRLARTCKQQEGKFAVAVTDYEKALSMAPSSPEKSDILDEYLDYLKSEKAHFADADTAFKRLLSTVEISPPLAGASHTRLYNPAFAEQTPGHQGGTCIAGDESCSSSAIRASSAEKINKIQGAYAEFLAWQKEKRPQALRILLNLALNNPQDQTSWRKRLDDVLLWQEANLSMMPFYHEVLQAFPDDKAAKISIARAYVKDPKHYTEALSAYSALSRQYPDDTALEKERLGAMISNQSKRPEALAAMEKMLKDQPNDQTLQITYAKLLSYQQEYQKALQIFNKVLANNPNNKEARIGRGLTMLWGGQRFAAKKYLEQTHKLYPEDSEVTMALIEAAKMTGRYDQALQLLKETKPGLNKSELTPSDSFILCSNETVKDTSLSGQLMANAVPDYSIAPQEIASSEGVSGGNYNNLSSSSAGQASAEASQLQNQLDDLNKSLDTLRQMQAKSSQEIEHLKNSLDQYQETIPATVSIQNPEPETASEDSSDKLLNSYMPSSYGQTGSLEFDDHHPLLSGYGSQSSQAMQDMERTLTQGFRPSFRLGYLQSLQKGNPTTTRFDTWGFPNQLSFFLTPQIQVRAGITPRRFYLPDSPVKPRSTWGTQYAWGATVKYWDRLTLDGDMAISHYFNSDSDNITYQTNAKIDITDKIHLKLGSHRTPYEESLLAYTGLRPYRGAFKGDLLGQARENAFYGEFNTTPFKNADWNIGYQWAFINGNDIPVNYKNQAYTSVGYTYNITPNHSVRAGYEFLWFSFNRNATNGYFDITGNVRQPLSNLSPVTLADPGYVYGGYFSPSSFFLNAFRLDFRGSFHNKLIEYRLGGSLGVQNFNQGHHIHDASPTTMASSFDSRVVLNLTDWLGLYGDADFMNSGGLFQRWRYGGGLILKPDIPAISPIIK